MTQFILLEISREEQVSIEAQAVNRGFAIKDYLLSLHYKSMKNIDLELQIERLEIELNKKQSGAPLDAESPPPLKVIKKAKTKAK